MENIKEQEASIDVDQAKKRARWFMIMSSFLLIAAMAATVIVYRLTVLGPAEGSDQGSTSAGSSGGGESKPELVRRAIDGVFVPPGSENFYPLAVMFDNNPDARPQSGIAKANLVYEAQVEGAATRYMGIFASGDKIDEIGPVRSARPYFLDWSEEFSAVYTHCGGSPEALARIIKEDIPDLNEFYNEKVFWRDADRAAPHNVYTSSENLYAYLNTHGYVDADYFSWKYKDDSPAGASASSSDQIAIPDFGASWEYDPVNNDYVRYLNGAKQKDRAGTLIRAKNVVVSINDSEVIDDVLRRKMVTTGEGEAAVCLDGECRTGRWKKNNSSARTRYYYEDGSEVEFNAGTTWVEVIDVGQEYSV